ncbi:hypothetical protein [Klebsiella pneumoniae]
MTPPRGRIVRQHRAGGQNEVLSPATPSSGRLMSTIIDTFVAPPGC